MLAELVQRSSLFSFLHQIDTEICRQWRERGCPFCGGVLHRAYYERKPRGVPDDLPEEYMIRQSLCCSREDCRRRVLPPSCLFMGRRVYWAGVIVVIMALRQNRPEGSSTICLVRRFGISRKTLFRWIVYFRDVFPLSAHWQRLRGRVGAWFQGQALPGGLLHHFMGNAPSEEAGLIGCLRFLAQAG